MTTVSNGFDTGTNPAYRSTTFTDSDFLALDVLDIYASLGRSGIKIEIETAADASVTIRLNAVRTIYGLNTYTKAHQCPAPDWDNTGTITDTAINTITVENGETYSENIVVKNIQITALTAGSGVTIKVR